MNYHVKVGDRFFTVRIDDLHARPIIAIVDGEPIEVWPLGEGLSPNKPNASSIPEKSISSKPPLPSQMIRHQGNGSQALKNGSHNEIHAPIPGIVLSIAVQPGVEVDIGQELCCLEAMKMKNIIRSPRSGKISAVKISPGQSVNHNEVLMEFVE